MAKTKATSQAAKVAPKASPVGMQGLGQAMRGNPQMALRGSTAGMQGLGQAMRSNPQMAQNLGKAAAMQGLGQAMGPGPQGGPPPQSKFMALRDGAAGAPTMGAGMQGLGQAMRGNPQMAQNVGKAAGTAMGGMGMKSGGSASSRADGIATKGKTKGRFV